MKRKKHEKKHEKNTKNVVVIFAKKYVRVCEFLSIFETFMIASTWQHRALKVTRHTFSLMYATCALIISLHKSSGLSGVNTAIRPLALPCDIS